MVDVDPRFLEQIFGPLYATLGRYHQYSFVGAETIPREGGVLGITSHGMATYELFLTAYAIYLATGRPVRALGDAIWFRTELLANTFGKLGMVNTGPEVARQLLEQGNIVAVAPGGVREAIRPATKRFQFDWEGRSGFARLALEARKPIMLVTCPAVDLVYTLYDNPLTKFAYHQWKLPIPVMFGVGPTLIPRPVKLTGYCHPPFMPPAIAGDRATDDEVRQYRDELAAKMNAFMDEVCEKEGLPRSRQRHSR